MSVEDKNSCKITKPILIGKPIKIEEYIYRLKLDDNGICIKAKKENSPSRYLCFIMPNSIERYESLNGIIVLYHTINNLLIKKSSDNDDNNHFTVKYDVEQDRIIMKLIMGCDEIEDTFIWRLEKTSAIEKRKKLKLYNQMVADHKELVAKVKESCLIIIQMQQDPDIIEDIKKIAAAKFDEDYPNGYYSDGNYPDANYPDRNYMENSAEYPRYMVDINSYNDFEGDDSWKINRFDVRNIKDVLIFYDSRVFQVTLNFKNDGFLKRIIHISANMGQHHSNFDPNNKENPLFPKNTEDIKKKKYLDFLNALTDYEGSIMTYGICIFDFINKCKKIKRLVIDRCEDYLDMSRVLNFPELESLKIEISENIDNIHNIDILQRKHNALKNLQIDHRFKMKKEK